MSVNSPLNSSGSGFWGNLNTTISTIGTTFAGVWNSINSGGGNSGGGSITDRWGNGSNNSNVNNNPSQNNAMSVDSQTIMLFLAGGALLTALVLMFKGHR